MSTVNLYTGDSLEVLKGLEANSVDSIVCDPPYGLSFMAKKWDYDVPSKELWEQALRVLKPGGHLLAFGGTRTYHRLVVNIEDAGFEIRDQIQWLYGSGFPKSMNLKDDNKGWGTALKPANEPICVARKPLEKGLTVAQNVLKYGTGAINIDESRISLEANVNLNAKQKNFDAMGYGGNENTDGVSTYNSQGRWPANIILDEVAAEMLDEQSGHLKGGGQNYSSNADSMFGTNKKFSPSRFAGDSGGASRFFYCAKASKSERNRGLEGMPEKEKKTLGDYVNPSEGRTASKSGSSMQNFHPTVKPIRLMEYLIRLVTPKGGTTLDPFMGSGTTGVAAKNLGFNFIGIELNPEYVTIAEKRIAVEA